MINMESKIDYGMIIRARQGDEAALDAIVRSYDKLISFAARKLGIRLRLTNEETCISQFEAMIRQELLLKVLYEYDEGIKNDTHPKGRMDVFCRKE